MSPAPAELHQRSFEEMGTPLHDVSFCVIDLETTGTSPADCMITEIGAVKLRGGECLGTFHTLVDPGCAIPPRITVITGITESMVANAPRIDSVTPSLLEFIGDSVVVGHNVRFDMSFINATLAAQRRPRLDNRTIDTLALARRLLRPEVPNCRLGTLAERFRLDHQPSHRALDDALATGDLLHLLIERAAAMGATGLDDLSTLPTMAGNPQAGKLQLTEALPRSPGVYLFRGRGGGVLYVGKAANLRSRVRSYFSTDQRRKIGQLLREVAAIDHQECRNGLEAAVLEIRLIHRHLPRFNQHGTRSGRYPYIRLTLHEAFPRLSIVDKVTGNGDLHLGPVSSRKRARLIVEALQASLPIRRCAVRIPAQRASDCSAKRGSLPTECTPSQLGVAMCPCSGLVDEASYRPVVSRMVAGLTTDHDILLDPLRERIRSLAQQERFEEAADMRDRADALSTALRDQRLFRALSSAGEIVFTSGGSTMRVVDGRLADLAAPDGEPRPSGHHDPRTPPARGDADEMLCIGRWMMSHAADIRLEDVSGTLAEPARQLPSFAPGKPGRSDQPAATSASNLARARPSSTAADA